MKTFAAFMVISCLISVSVPASAEDEITLFDSHGKATAYITLDDELTIYLWSGQPVAYLDQDSQGGFHVYGFNGEHLGWFVDGVLWDASGYASCAVKERLQSTKFEPFKSFKKFKPFKSFKRSDPSRPIFSDSFGDIPCNFLLVGGKK
jgi:hypothetical protein